MQNLTIMSVKGEKLAFTTSIIFLKGISSTYYTNFTKQFNDNKNL